MSDYSTNPVQNKVVKEYIDEAKLKAFQQGVTVIFDAT